MTEEKQLYFADYPTDHIRTSLKPHENHPSEVFAIAVFQSVPREYVEQAAKSLAESLSEKDKIDHPMGVVWETLNRMLNGEEVHGRYLMGAALYIANTLYNVGQGCTLALQQQAEQAAQEETSTEDSNEDTTS